MAKNEKKINMDCPVFIIFAEYFGYVSSFTKMCEAWCNGNVPELHVQKFLKVEAASILKQMKKDYTNEQIREYYNRYRPLVLKEWDDKLKKITTVDDDNI